VSEQPDIDRLADELRNWRPDSSYPAIDRAEFDAALEELVALARERGRDLMGAEARVAELESHLEQSELYRQAEQDRRMAAEARVAELKAIIRAHWSPEQAEKLLAGDGGGA